MFYHCAGAAGQLNMKFQKRVCPICFDEPVQLFRPKIVLHFFPIILLPIFAETEKSEKIGPVLRRIVRRCLIGVKNISSKCWRQSKNPKLKTVSNFYYMITNTL